MLPTGLCNIGHSALTPISRSDITSVFSFDNHQKNILWCSLSRNRQNQNCFFLKSGTLIFVLLGIITADGCLHSAFVLPSFCLRSGFALPSLLRVETKSIQNGMKKPRIITYPFFGRTNIICQIRVIRVQKILLGISFSDNAFFSIIPPSLLSFLTFISVFFRIFESSIFVLINKEINNIQ